MKVVMAFFNEGDVKRVTRLAKKYNGTPVREEYWDGDIGRDFWFLQSHEAQDFLYALGLLDGWGFFTQARLEGGHFVERKFANEVFVEAARRGAVVEEDDHDPH